MKRMILCVVMGLGIILTPIAEVKDGVIPNKEFAPQHIISKVFVKMPVEEVKQEEVVEEDSIQTPVRSISMASRGGSLERPKYSQDDLYWLSRVVSAESKDQPEEGMVAVANVVMNRKGFYPKMSIKEIIFTKGQFDVVGNGTIHNEPIPLAIEVAKKVLNGYRMMPDDVYYFYNPKIAGDSWIKTRKVWKRIGDHLFCYR